MSVSGVVDDVAEVSWPSDGRPAWRVLVTPDKPTALAGGDGKPLAMLLFYAPRDRAAAPIGAGDRVVLPLLHGNRAVPVTRADGSAATVRMLGWVVDPAAPLT